MIAECKKIQIFDPTLDVVLNSDASPYGVGAQVCNRDIDGTLRTVAFASSTLSKAEASYAQSEREALGVVFGDTCNVLPTIVTSKTVH